MFFLSHLIAISLPMTAQISASWMFLVSLTLVLYRKQQGETFWIIRWVMRAQIQFQLKVRRIVYFLPGRGPLEKAVIQEELRVLYHYFGKDIFDCMVVAATNSPSKK